MQFKKLRKVYRIFFPKHFSTLEVLSNKLETDAIKEIIQVEDLFQVTFQNDIRVIVRNEKHSDSKVFHQIFILEEYALILKLMTLNSVFDKQKIIIDAGANVGYTTVYFSSIFHDAKFYSIEPSQENAACFLQNINDLKNKLHIKLYQKALAHKAGLNFEINRDFRDKKDWSIATLETETGNIEGISIQEIINENKLPHISLLKIDIEGAERFIFTIKNDLSFLKITEILAIEIHDEFEIRETINKLLLDSGFLIFESGELTIGVNKKAMV